MLSKLTGLKGVKFNSNRNHGRRDDVAAEAGELARIRANSGDPPQPGIGLSKNRVGFLIPNHDWPGRIRAPIMTRVMISRDRNQVEAVKRELARAGIQTEIRSNPLAAALRVSRVELWVQNERDFTMASKICAELEARFVERPGATGPDIEAEVQVIIEEPPPRQPMRVVDSGQRPRATEPERVTPKNNSPPSDAIEQAAVLLEKEIEALMARETDLEQKCESQQTRINSMTAAAAQLQAQVGREVAAREAVEKKAALLAEAQAALQRELRETQSQLQARDQTLASTRTELQARQQEVRSHQAKVAEVTNELAKAQNQIVAERQSRTAAEGRAAKLDALNKTIEQNMEEQARLQQQLQTYAGNLTSLRNKLHARNSAKPRS